LIGVFLALGFPNMFSRDASGAQPTGTIMLDCPESVAHVGPGENGTVKATGSVLVEMSGPGQSFQEVEVSLQVSSGWPATITPSTMTFLPEDMGTSKHFEVFIRVPNFTSFTQSGEYIISGRMTPHPGTVSYNLQETKGIITIAPYTQLNLFSHNPCQDVIAGDIASCELSIRNEGNCRIHVSFEVKNYEELTDDGLNVSFPYNDIAIDEAKEDMVEFLVAVPHDAGIRSYTIPVIGRASAGNATDEKEYRFILNVTGGSDPGGNGGGGSGSSGNPEDGDEVKDKSDGIPGFGALTVFSVLGLALLYRRSKRI